MQRSLLVSLILAVAVVVLVVSCAPESAAPPEPPPCAGGKCDSPGTPKLPLAGTVGQCVPFYPVPGYRTCVMTEAQIETTPPGPVDDQTSDTLPEKVDHHAEYLEGCLQPHDQGSCGWCTAHSTTAALEALLCKGKHPYRRISEPHLWWLGKERGAFKQCKGGWYISSAFKNLGVMTDAGYLLARSSVWAYTDDLAAMNKAKPSDSDLHNKGEHGAPSKHTGTVYSKSATAVKQALASGHNVVYSVPTFKDVGWKWWDSDYPNIVVPNPAPPGTCTCDDCPKQAHCRKGHHAILIVGYDDAKKRFTFLNSWSSYWGSVGYGTIDYATINQYGSGGRYTTTLKLSPTPLTLDGGQPDLAGPDAGVTDLGPDPDAGVYADAADTGPPQNGGATCQNPAPLPLGGSPTVVTGSTTGAPNEHGLSINCGTGLTFDGQQRYYRLDLKAGAAYTVKLKPSGYDAVLYAFPDTGSCSVAAINSGCNGHAADKWGGDGAEQLTLTTTYDQEWIVAVDSFDPAAAGGFTLEVGW